MFIFRADAHHLLLVPSVPGSVPARVFLWGGLVAQRVQIESPCLIFLLFFIHQRGRLREVQWVRSKNMRWVFLLLHVNFRSVCYLTHMAVFFRWNDMKRRGFQLWRVDLTRKRSPQRKEALAAASHVWCSILSDRRTKDRLCLTHLSQRRKARTVTSAQATPKGRSAPTASVLVRIQLQSKDGRVNRHDFSKQL